MDGGTQVGLFGAIGRETKGALRSLGYDLRRSRRIQRIGAITVVAVAGGVIATGAFLREPVPGMVGLGDEDSDITEGWFGLGADTTGQDAESSEAESSTGTNEAPHPEAATSTAEVEARGKTVGEAPGLVPVGDETSRPAEEEDGEVSPSPTQEPTEEPTDEPTEEAPTTEAPTEEPTTEAPTTQEPTPSPTVTTTEDLTQEPTQEPTSTPTAEPNAERATLGPRAPIPRKGPIEG
ncbi:hypothetical protein [Glycomyces rhizosphaerae]|uniref:Uncharacterized protein n=1 Tax=Glycomyces rhizosphaerae TaxID=2054422 RepID=A0ABV7Q112_9ACTN